MRPLGALALVGVLLGGLTSLAHADDAPSKALFALVIGVNRSVDPELPTLRYADDDAARYHDLFRALGARTYLLTRADESTRRLHSQAAAEALEPRRAALSQAVARLVADVEQARRRQVQTVFYFVYAGHGNVKEGTGYLALEDARLSAAAIEQEILDKIQATESHVIVDACHSFFLAQARGPGGKRRPLSGFARLQGLGQRGNVGLLLSTSSTRESHEWAGYQGGVFSHQVRSGLYGAADVDGDGKISYREIAAFVSRANAAIPNERFRPEVFARPPLQQGELVDLRLALRRGLKIDGARHGRYLLEDARGVRLAEFNSGAGQPVALIRPASSGPLYLHRIDKGTEYRVPPSPEPIEVAALVPTEPQVRVRGASHDAFALIFTLPFDRKQAESYRFPSAPSVVAEAPAPDPDRTRRILTWSFLGVGAAALIAGVTVTVVSKTRGQAEAGGRSDVPLGMNSAQSSSPTRAIDRAIPALYGTAGALALGGLIYHLWPRAKRIKPSTIGRIGPGPGDAGLGYSIQY